MQDKIEARKRLVNKALFEAAHRERSGVEITIPAMLGFGEGTAVDSGLVAAANAHGSASGQNQRPEESGISNSDPRSMPGAGTVGTFAAPPYQAPRVPVLHTIALAVVAVMAAVGIALIVIVLVTRNGSHAKAAAREGAPSRPVASAPIASAAGETGAADPAVAIAPWGRSSAPAKTAPSAAASSTSEKRTPGAQAAGTGAGTSTSTTKPSAPGAAGAQNAAAQPKATAPPTKTQTKRRDDEAGF